MFPTAGSHFYVYRGPYRLLRHFATRYSVRMTLQIGLRHRVRTRRDQADRYGIRSQNCSRYVLHLTSLPPTLLILAHSLTMGRPSRNAWYRNISSNTSLTKILSSTRLERGMARWPLTSLASSGAPFQTLRAYLITHRGDKWSSSKDAGRTLCHVASLRQYHLQEYLS